MPAPASIATPSHRADPGDAMTSRPVPARLAYAEAAGRLEAAAALATGEFLTGFDDEWVLEARDAHRARLAAVLGRLASAAMENGDQAAALRWTRRQAAIDPLAEEPQRRLM